MYYVLALLVYGVIALGVRVQYRSNQLQHWIFFGTGIFGCDAGQSRLMWFYRDKTITHTHARMSIHIRLPRS
jgi:hypothetical protein